MATNHADTVRLKQPTDFDILEAMSDGRRDVGVNIAEKLGRDRGYINTRLPDLRDYGLLTKVGPAPNSGVYEITPEGLAALALRDRYDELGRDEFEDLVDDRADAIEIGPPRVIDTGE
jgi:DNA-binding PadR family transcriptional regulator